MDEMNYTPTPQNTNQVPKVSTTWYWVLAIAALLFSGIIFGVISIMNVRKINTATTIEEQEKAKKHAIMWAAIGLALSIIVNLIALL